MGELHIQDVTILGEVSPGDILHVRVGLSAEEMGDGCPWIPSAEELDYYKQEFESVVPEGVTILVTHPGVTLGVVKDG